jgi:hypothetical protein
MAREDQSVRNHDILPPASGKYNDFCNVIRGKWLAASATTYQLNALSTHPSQEKILRIDCIRLLLISIESHNGEFLTVV